MPERRVVTTTCNRDCPDACEIHAEVEGDRVVRLRGSRTHPVTQGFLCHRTGRYLDRQYDPSRITRPLLRRGDRQVEIPLDEALDLAAEQLTRIRAESGPAAILHYRSGGSLGLLKHLVDRFFDAFGPVSTKRGDICSGAGDAAQLADFGVEDSNDLFDLAHSRHVICWGKNVFVSSVHLLPVLDAARARGASLTLVDPVATRTARIADEHVMVRPGGDPALALAVLRILFEEGRVDARAAARCEGVDALRALATGRPLAAWLEDSDVPEAAARRLADRLSDGPTAILVGWGLQRRAQGAATVRLLDALSMLSGNLHRPGGGASFYFRRRGAFDAALLASPPPPRTFPEPLLGQALLEARDPPVRAVWITAGNPVAMLPDSATVARALEQVEFSVVVDAFPTDTTRRATLVLPTTTLLEDDDLLGAYGHHFLAVSRPVVPPPPGVLTDLELVQALARRVGLEHAVAGTAREWKARLLAPVADRGASLEALERGPVKNPIARPVLFADLDFETPTRRMRLLDALPPAAGAPPDYPLWLMSSSTDRSQSSQWAKPLEGDLPATVHPDTAGALADGSRARLVSPLGALAVRVVHDPAQRRDVVLVPKGGSFDRGHAANALVPARLTDAGEGAAYLDARVRLEPLLDP